MLTWLRRLLLLLALLAVGSSPASAQVGQSLGVIDPNVAPESDLLAVAGLNPDVVKAILDARPFMTMAEFDAFLGRVLDRNQRRAVYLRLFVPIDVNTTTDEEWRLVPGIGAHMLMDFKTNRPFGSLASFRQEIGKYLPPKDAALVTQYVFVPLDANAASDDDLRTIPGLSPKALAAIKRHRPYHDLAAVSKAIRKTTSAKEAARLSRFFRIGTTP
jgi:DNA uptake protein ComE-like DNA-binding protein